MNKRGQFFLMAAFIIVGIIAGLASVVNVATVNPDRTGFYDLSREVGYETKYLVDYGVYNSYDENAKDELVRNFLEKYSDYIGQDRAVFLYGDRNGMTALYFASLVQGVVGIETQEINGVLFIPIGGIAGEEVQAEITDSGEDFVSVKIDGTDYTFQLRPGENFFSVIIKIEGGEQFVSSG